MRRLLVFFALSAGLAELAGAQTTSAFPFTYYIHDTTGQTADQPLPSIYQFAATSLGSSSHVVLKAVNTSSAAAFMGAVFVANSSTSTVQNTNFIITGQLSAQSVPAGASVIFTVNFSPTVTGPITGYLETSYQVPLNGCSFTSNNLATQCPSLVNVSATLTATATQPQLVLSYQSATGSTVLQPSSTALNFGSVPITGKSTITFTLTNQSTVAISIPAITLPPPTIYTAGPFLLDLSTMPSSGVLAPGASANFNVTFEPGDDINYTGPSFALVVGSNQYLLTGAGYTPPVADISSLKVCYADGVGDQSLPQPLTPIPFSLSFTGANVLRFMVTNPLVSFNAVTVPSVTVTGPGFALNSAVAVSTTSAISTSICPIPASANTTATSFPVSLMPGSSLIFTITFTPTVSGTSAGSLSIGSLGYLLSGVSPASPLPSFSLTVNPAPLTSKQLATAAVQFTAPSTVNLVGTISMTFAPSVTGAADDPAIMFMATGGRTLSISVASGGQNATYNSQSALSFQTGTTAGTITFTVSFPNTTTFTQSFTITPSIVQITSASAVRSNPNLVVTLAGYDNTYSAGQVNFAFYDTSGNAISPIAVNAASDFQSLFFNNNQGGGTFSLVATFPVTGDVTKIGTVAVSISNSIGQANTTLTFQ